MNRPAAAPETKSHYQILDGLRGVAALIVVIFHTFEPWSDGDHKRQILNHGYLAVDFFFLLSGFVVAYAYDDRWSRMTQWDFYKRRLIRLQPMVIMGSIIGAIFFYTQAGPVFPLIAATPVWKLLLVMVVGCTLIPLPVSMDIRGWSEMHPLDGPAWSLFFEYVANIFYAVGVRKFSNKLLGVLVFLSGVLLLHLAVTSPLGDVIGGWSLDATQLHVGFARLLYPFFAGVLLMRLGKRIHVKGAFGWCSLLVVLALCIPRIGAGHAVWINGLYDALCIILIFPVIVLMGATKEVSSGVSEKVCRFFGEISYPLYITHYPLIYLYTEWVGKAKPSPAYGTIMGAGLFVAAVTIAYGCLRLYDLPVRNWLTRRFLARRVTSTGAIV